VNGVLAGGGSRSQDVISIIKTPESASQYRYGNPTAFEVVSSTRQQIFHAFSPLHMPLVSEALLNCLLEEPIIPSLSKSGLGFYPTTPPYPIGLFKAKSPK
jgi:hypothetical protein